MASLVAEAGVPSGSDIAEIQNLLNRVMLAMDTGDAEAFSSCFTPDGTCSVMISGTKSRGIDELADLCLGIHTKFCAGPNLRCRHWEGNVCILRDASSSEELTNMSYWKALNGGEVISTGIHRDKIVSFGGEWRISSREIVHTWTKAGGHIPA